MNTQDRARLMAKLKENTRADGDCIVWTGAPQSRGYGYMRRPSGGYILTHRAAYELYYGEKPDKGMMVLHTCHNRLCCNPEHLYAGTAADNALDAVEAGPTYHRRVPIDLTELALLKSLDHLTLIEAGQIVGVDTGTVAKYRKRATNV
jgi:HNH endonuclease